MNLNRIQIVGNLTTDPMIGQDKNGSLYATLTVATNHRWRSKVGGEMYDTVEYHHVQAWDALADSIRRIDPKKGDLVYVEGRNQTRLFVDKDGHEKKITEIIVHAFANMITKTQAIKARNVKRGLLDDEE